jgi:hypothetical protein
MRVLHATCDFDEQILTLVTRHQRADEADHEAPRVFRAQNRDGLRPRRQVREGARNDLDVQSTIPGCELASHGS